MKYGKKMKEEEKANTNTMNNAHEGETKTMKGCGKEKKGGTKITKTTLTLSSHGDGPPSQQWL